MIKNYTKFNEGIKHLLVGPTKEEVWSNLIDSKLKGLIDHIPESPEDFFNQMKQDCVEMGYDIFGKFYGKNGIELFLQGSKNGILYISYKYIWSVLEKIYGLNNIEIQLFIKNQLKNDTKWKRFTPVNGSEPLFIR